MLIYREPGQRMSNPSGLANVSLVLMEMQGCHRSCLEELLWDTWRGREHLQEKPRKGDNLQGIPNRPCWKHSTMFSPSRTNKEFGRGSQTGATHNAAPCPPNSSAGVRIPSFHSRTPTWELQTQPRTRESQAAHSCLEFCSFPDRSFSFKK